MHTLTATLKILNNIHTKQPLTCTSKSSTQCKSVKLTCRPSRQMHACEEKRRTHKIHRAASNFISRCFHFSFVSVSGKKLRRHAFILCTYALLQRIPGIYCKCEKLLSHHSTLFPTRTVGQTQSTSYRVTCRTFSVEPGMDKTSKVRAESSGGKQAQTPSTKLQQCQVFQ